MIMIHDSGGIVNRGRASSYKGYKSRGNVGIYLFVVFRPDPVVFQSLFLKIAEF